MRRLDHEKLEVHQASLAFIGWLEPLLRLLPEGLAVFDPLDRASRMRITVRRLGEKVCPNQP